nr:hypothetical protein [Tanacetum cinerariifolium]
LKYGRVVRIASKPEMSSSTARVQQSIKKKVQSSDGNNNQKKMSNVRDALLNPLSQNGIKLECNQEDDMREDKEDVEWVGDKLNEADGKTYYRSCCINGTTYQLQHCALFSSTGKILVPGKLLVYESNYQLTLPADSIDGPCEVLPPKKFSKERAMQSRAQ